MLFEPSGATRFYSNPVQQPTDCDTLCRGMGGPERNPGTTRRPQRSTGLPAPILITSRLSWVSWDGFLVGVHLSTSPKRRPCRTHTGFVTLVINPINQRCCKLHQCCQHHRPTLDISLYCRGSCDSSAGVWFVLPCVGVSGLKQESKMVKITLYNLANEAARKIRTKKLASCLLFWQAQISRNLPVLAKKLATYMRMYRKKKLIKLQSEEIPQFETRRSFKAAGWSFFSRPRFFLKY